MKVLSISIACYNVEGYLRQTLSSLLCKNLDKLEVLIVNDGSVDKTLEVAKEFTTNYPATFKIIDKANGGYGSTINSAILVATGKYFKQLDGDDKFDTDNLDKLIESLETSCADVVYTPFYYWTDDKLVLEGLTLTSPIIELDFNEFYSNYKILIAMHSLCYKTSILRDNDITILENCFYTDTEFAIYPFKYINTITLLPYPVYLYRIGVEGQSVSPTGVRKHYEDYQKVITSIVDNMCDFADIQGEGKREYILTKIDDTFHSCLVNLIKFLPYSITSYKFIKGVDGVIKQKNPTLYTNKKKKTLTVFRKGKFIIYTFLQLILKIRYLLFKK